MSLILRPHQTANVQGLIAALTLHGGALDGSDTGTGKTFTFVGLCKTLGARPAIVTRKALIPQWEAACRLAGLDPLFIANYEQCRSAKFPHGQVTTSPRGSKSYQWNITEPRCIFAFDEAQALRSPSTMNSKMALAARKKFKTVLLSATPFQTPLEAKTIGLIIGLFSEHTYWSWMFRNGVKKNYMGHLEFVGDRKGPGNAEAGLEHMARIRDTIFPSRGVRTRREDIPGFPETLVLCESVETGEADAITEAYREEVEAARAGDHARMCADVDPEFHDLVNPLPITVNLRGRQEAEILKCKAIAEMAEIEYSKGQHVAIFVNFDASVDLLSSYLKCDHIVRGDGSGKSRSNNNRHQVVTDFRENRTPYIIVNIAAGGVGLSLHDEVKQVPRVALISPPYSAVMLKQVLGRTHRLGGGHSTQKILFASGTVEENVMRRVKNRLDNIDTLLDTDLVVTK